MNPQKLHIIPVFGLKIKTTNEIVTIMKMLILKTFLTLDND